MCLASCWWLGRVSTDVRNMVRILEQIFDIFFEINEFIY